MKKAICILFTFQLLILSIIGIDLFENKKLNDILYKNTTSVLLSFDSPRTYSKEFGKYLSDLGRNNQISISKYVFKSKNELIIYTSDTTLNNKIKLIKGVFPENNQFISNTYSDDLQQSGLFTKIDPELKINIKNMDMTNNISGEGIYYISTINQDLLNNIIADLNDNVASTKIVDTTKIISTNISQEEIICILLLLLCLLMTITQYSIYKLKKVIILRINGFSIVKILSNIGKKFIYILMLASIIGYIILAIYYIYLNSFNYFFELSFYYLLISILFSSLYIFTFMILMLLNLKIAHKINAIKGKKNYYVISFMQYGLKLIFILALLISLHQVFIKASIINKQIENYTQWNKTQNLYTIAVTYNGEDDAKKHVETSNKIEKFYEKIIKEKNGFIVSSDNYSKVDNTYLYELNCEDVSPEVSPNGKRITVNENYFKYNDIESVNSSVLNQIDYNDNVINILVPEKLKNYEQDIKANYKKYFYFQKVEVENIYNKKLNLQKNTTLESDLKVNIIYVKNNQYYFSYNSTIEFENNNLIKDPIVVIYTGNIDNSSCLSYMTNSFYFYSNAEDPFNEIKPIILECDLESSIQKVISVYDKYGNEIQKIGKECNKLVIVIIILFISNFISIYNLMISYYEKNKYKLYIKKLFGYNFLRLNRTFILMLILIDIIPVIVISMFYGFRILLAGITLIFLELLSIIIMDKLLSIKSFNSIIKGEH